MSPTRRRFVRSLNRWCRAAPGESRTRPESLWPSRVLRVGIPTSGGDATKLAATLGLVLLLFASPVVSQVPDDKLIVPGQRIGRFALTMSVADVTGILGPSTNLSPGRFGDQALQNDLTLYIWDVVPLVVIARDERAPVSIGIRRSSDYQTAQGLKYLAQPEAVRDALGAPTREVQWGARTQQRALIYDGLGIAFLTADEGIVGSILVFRPQSANRIWKP